MTASQRLIAIAEMLGTPPHLADDAGHSVAEFIEHMRRPSMKSEAQIHYATRLSLLLVVSLLADNERLRAALPTADRDYASVPIAQLRDLGCRAQEIMHAIESCSGSPEATDAVVKAEVLVQQLRLLCGCEPGQIIPEEVAVS